MARNSELPDPAGPAGGALDRELLPVARRVGRELRLRAELAPQLDEARWMILLDIFQAMGDARPAPFMSAAHASSASVSSAQRYIHEMIAAGLISQHRSGADQRITHVKLTETGIALVHEMLAGVIALRARS